jgi:hypothetical protein
MIMALAATSWLTAAGPSWAWGARGHEWVSGVAIERLPDSVPAFVRTPEAAAKIAVLGRELDRSKGAGAAHDAELDPGHWIVLSDDGAAMGVLPLAGVPETREGYDTLLREHGFTQHRAGYLALAIVIGWQQVRMDFGYWRALGKAIETAKTPEERAWFQADRKLREEITVHDIGIWSHYLGDASQPLHVSVHYAGWGDYPNPHGYTQRNIDSSFESVFVKQNVKRAGVAAAVDPYTPCACSIQERTRALLLASLRQVEPLYALEKEGGFTNGDRRGIAFTTARLAAGAAALRDMIVDAWLDSEDAMVGSPPVRVRDIETGKVIATRDLFYPD